MKSTKIIFDEIKRCYSTQEIEVNNEKKFFFASEDPEVGAFLFSEDGKNKSEMWKAPGGCMSFLPIPGCDNEFLAVQEFYLKVSPSLSKLVWCKYTSEGWIFKDALKLPYLHRFDIFEVNGKVVVLCATIAKHKEDKEDWSQAGEVLVGELSKDHEVENLKVILDGNFRNHGYCHGEYEGSPCGYVSGDQGVFRIIPPMKQSDWQVTKIMDGKISDIAVVDLDSDGQEEIMTIEPFHGNQMKIYKNSEQGYKEIYTYPYEIDFAHALVGDTILGKPSFVAGVRRKDAEVVVIQMEGNRIKETKIDKDAGPANLCVVHREGYDLILSANHTENKAVVYRMEEEE